jgi:hypothetical protein
VTKSRRTKQCDRNQRPVNMLIEIVIFLFTFLFAYFAYNYYNVHKTLYERGIKFIAGFPVLGNTYASTMCMKHLADEMIELYNAFPNER